MYQYVTFLHTCLICTSMCSCSQRHHFLHLLGKIEFYIVSFKHTILSTVDEPSMLSQRNALLQNRILKCVFSVFNIIRSMYRRVFKHDSSSPLAHKSTVQYLFSAPVPIPLRPSLIRCICGNSVRLLHMLRSSYLERISTCKNIRLARVHFYSFLLSKCSIVMENVLQTVHPLNVILL